MHIDTKQLPEPSLRGGNYTPVVVHQGMAFVSGQLAQIDNVVQFRGKVGDSIDVEQARQAAKLCATQCLAALNRELGGLDRVVRLLRVTGYVASANGFTQQPIVIDAASDYFCEVLGVAGEHARSAIGVAELPLGASVEIEITVAIKD
jgi:enamine deaminase RidA (YjgF/YER057c/UK114 family)